MLSETGALLSPTAVSQGPAAAGTQSSWQDRCSFVAGGPDVAGSTAAAAANELWAATSATLYSLLLISFAFSAFAAIVRAICRAVWKSHYIFERNDLEALLPKRGYSGEHCRR